MRPDQSLFSALLAYEFSNKHKLLLWEHRALFRVMMGMIIQSPLDYRKTPFVFRITSHYFESVVFLDTPDYLRLWIRSQKETLKAKNKDYRRAKQ